MENKVVRSDFFNGNLPNLQEAVAAPIELTAEYWTPENEGETRRAFFSEFVTETAIDEKSGGNIELITAYFVYEVDGVKKVFKNASKRLVGVLDTRNVPSGTPLEITYLGKKRNKNNSYYCDTWSIRPLYVKDE